MELPQKARINRPDKKPLNGPSWPMTPATPIFKHLARPRRADIKEKMNVIQKTLDSYKDFAVNIESRKSSGIEVKNNNVDSSNVY